MNRCATVAAVATSLAVVAAGCGLTGDGEFQRIGSDDLAGLDETTTSTTTTTTIPPAVPSSVVETTLGGTSTTIATEPVELYFLDGDQLAPISINLARGPSVSRVLEVLEAGPPPGEVGIGLRSRVPRQLIATVSESGGVASVDLAPAAFEGIEDIDQRIAIAQIVLTLTMRPGIGQVAFSLDGVALAVPGQDNVQTEPGDPVSREDYESLLLEQGVQPDTTTIPPTAPPTTVVETTATTAPA